MFIVSEIPVAGIAISSCARARLAFATVAPPCHPRADEFRSLTLAPRAQPLPWARGMVGASCWNRTSDPHRVKTLPLGKPDLIGIAPFANTDRLNLPPLLGDSAIRCCVLWRFR